MLEGTRLRQRFRVRCGIKALFGCPLGRTINVRKHFIPLMQSGSWLSLCGSNRAAKELLGNIQRNCLVCDRGLSPGFPQSVNALRGCLVATRGKSSMAKGATSAQDLPLEPEFAAREICRTAPPQENRFQRLRLWNCEWILSNRFANPSASNALHADTSPRRSAIIGDNADAFEIWLELATSLAGNFRTNATQVFGLTPSLNAVSHLSTLTANFAFSSHGSNLNKQNTDGIKHPGPGKCPNYEEQNCIN